MKINYVTCWMAYMSGYAMVVAVPIDVAFTIYARRSGQSGDVYDEAIEGLQRQCMSLGLS